MSQMATPISNIPVSPTTAVGEEDPEVLAILQEMQPAQNPSPVKQVSHVLPSYHPSPPYTSGTPPANYPHPPPYSGHHAVPMDKKPLYDQTKAQRAIYASLLALLFFHPKTFEMVYKVAPKLNVLSSYEMLIRFALLAMVIYILLWKFEL